MFADDAAPIPDSTSISSMAPDLQTTTDTNGANVITVQSKYPAPNDIIAIARQDIEKAKAAGQHLVTLVSTNPWTSGGTLLTILGLAGLGYYYYNKN